MTTARGGRPTLAEARRLEQTIREAAVATFVEFGYSGASMDAIAKAAGVTRKTLYSRYPDKRSVFLEVLPWALSRLQNEGRVAVEVSDDVEADLEAYGMLAIRSSLAPENLRLRRIAMMESANFPEFSTAADSTMWAERQRALFELLSAHVDKGNLVLDDLELAAEHFLTLVESAPLRLAAFGVFRSKKQEERHLKYAVRLFLYGASATNTR
jgi:TetR/AcrR family transcriptional regulator, mexJK operon transcriptional repressor